jgi:hypothetical protein
MWFQNVWEILIFKVISAGEKKFIPKKPGFGRKNVKCSQYKSIAAIVFPPCPIKIFPP